MPDDLQVNTRPEHPTQQSIVDVAVGVIVDKVSIKGTHNNAIKDEDMAANHAQPIGHVLISRRKAEQVLGGYWELPGGKVEANETPAEAVVRELKEEVGIDATPIDPLPTVEHRYDHAHIRLHPFICLHTAGTASPIEVDEVRWVTPDQLSEYPMPQASLPVLNAFRSWLKTTANTTQATMTNVPHLSSEA